jgi:lipopolysaccharide/colanic/teichoic acid biosynthesis glycosyltransferase
MSRSEIPRSVPVASTPLDVRESPTGGKAAPLTEPASQVQVSTSRAYELAKRLFDVVFCVMALVLLAPLFALLALAIKLGDGGPVIYRREVVGRNGKRFYALKFRTMMPLADDYLAAHASLLARYNPQVKLRDDPRVTRVGRVLRHTSVDELPQFLNVLFGQMSLVGPRIIHPSEEERFGDFARIRRCVRPGVTGLWQVSGRQTVSYAQRLALDEEYLRRRSFWLDMRILCKTVVVVLMAQGAY